jgi:hypothetical protein
MNVKFSSGPYVASHGRPPRGTGCWGFSLMRYPSDVITQVFFPPASSLTEAKAHARKWAASEAARLGLLRVVVFIQP